MRKQYTESSIKIIKLIKYDFTVIEFTVGANLRCLESDNGDDTTSKNHHKDNDVLGVPKIKYWKKLRLLPEPP